MPKQGQFARSHHHKVVHDFRRRKSVQQHNQRTITEEMVPEFMVIRYALTTGKHFSEPDRETGQRFLQELVPRLMDNQYDIEQSVVSTLRSINSRVPWQFLMILSQRWTDLATFLRRELPALPLQKQVIIRHPMDQARFDQKVSQLLATKLAGITLIHQSNPQLQRTLTERLLQSIYDGTTIKWSAVQSLLAPFSFPVDDQLDDGTKHWLRRLKQVRS